MKIQSDWDCVSRETLGRLYIDQSKKKSEHTAYDARKIMRVCKRSGMEKVIRIYAEDETSVILLSS